MESYDALDAAIEIDNYLLGRLTLPTNSALRLSEAICDLTDKGLNENYPELKGTEQIFRDPTIKYLRVQIEKCTTFKDLGGMMEQVSGDLQNYSHLERQEQERLRDFCVNLSRKLGKHGAIGLITRCLAA